MCIEFASSFFSYLGIGSNLQAGNGDFMGFAPGFLNISELLSLSLLLSALSTMYQILTYPRTVRGGALSTKVYSEYTLGYKFLPEFQTDVWIGLKRRQIPLSEFTAVNSCAR